MQLTEFQSCQIEDLQSSSTQSENRQRRQKRSPYIQSLTGDQNNGDAAHAFHHPTYIYGLPMMEYRRERITRMESGQNLGTGGGVGGGADFLKMKMASTQPVMSTRNINGGIHEAETLDSATLKSSSDELLKAEESSPQEVAVHYADKSAVTLAHDASLPVAGEVKARNEEKEDGEREKEVVEGEKMKMAVRKEEEEEEGEDFYYYDSYEDYDNDYNYVYEEGMYDYSSDGQVEDTAGGSFATFIPDEGEEYWGGEDTWREAGVEAREGAMEDVNKEVQWKEGDAVDRTGVTVDSPGAHYRQSDVGTLAFDRAFLYAVRHNPTGLLLFLGRYLDPQAN